MIAVLFEAIPSSGHREEYMDLAARLRPELENIKGFISVERYQSLSQPEKLLSLSFWENEAAVAQWRNTSLHRAAQLKGRNYIFCEYRLRVGEIVRDYGREDRRQAPPDSSNGKAIFYK